MRDEMQKDDERDAIFVDVYLLLLILPHYYLPLIFFMLIFILYYFFHFIFPFHYY